MGHPVHVYCHQYITTLCHLICLTCNKHANFVYAHIFWDTLYNDIMTSLNELYAIQYLIMPTCIAIHWINFYQINMQLQFSFQRDEQWQLALANYICGCKLLLLVAVANENWSCKWLFIPNLCQPKANMQTVI